MVVEVRGGRLEGLNGGVFFVGSSDVLGEDFSTG